MKKFTTKLLMSIIAVAFAFVALGTSTYAWFSMNTSVSVTDMTVAAKSNASYLLIGQVNTSKADFDTTKTGVKVNTTNTEKVYPIALATSAIEDKVQAGQWYTASSKDPAAPTVQVHNYQVKSLGDENYFIQYKCYLTLSDDSEDVTDKKLKVTFAGTDADTSVSAYVVVGGDKLIADLDSTNNTFTTSANVTFSKDAYIEVLIYLYIDGTAEHVYSDYINNEATKDKLSGTVALTFDLV